MKASTIERLGYCDLIQYKLWLDEECSKELDERK
jgi:hypothetical protein